MKYLTLITICTSYFLGLFSAERIDFRPPGTAKIVDNFFMDKGELTNIDWKEYLYSIEQEHGKNSDKFLAALPDTTVWRDGKGYYEPFVKSYFRHTSYDYYPVVGISYSQAVEYCVWRTKAVKEMMKANDIAPVNFKYRLPTQTEWELVANAGHNKKQKKILSKHYKKFSGKAKTHNMVFEHLDEFNTSQLIAPSTSLLPNKYDIYNIYGNVAEMVAEENVAVGGSFLDRYEEIVPSNKTLKYDGPQMWLGFRCAAEILE